MNYSFNIPEWVSLAALDDHNSGCDVPSVNQYTIGYTHIVAGMARDEILGYGSSYRAAIATARLMQILEPSQYVWVRAEFEDGTTDIVAEYGFDEGVYAEYECQPKWPGPLA